MVFDKEKHIDIELSVSEEYLQKNYDGKLTQVMVGPEYELFARLCKVSPIEVTFLAVLPG